ncbi:PTHR1 [Mytilus coruscus]|uniref:PTHR1 n=1 Tax=Mytilus coruscus TaxID=42192 RepID=A0A6J8C216_MYTCO|nr:PTHR1 [Mytilus coruscus]
MYNVNIALLFKGVVDITLSEQNHGIGDANQTCTQLIEKEQNTKNDSFCERVWDTIACWPSTPPGSLATIPCPNYLNGFNTAAFAHKYCTSNGTWFYHPVLNLTWTDYTNCPYTSIMEDIPELIKKHMPYIRLVFNIGYGISLVSLVLATTLMIAFRRLRCPRNTVHINLFISFILRASISFMKENLLVNSAAFASDVKEVNGKLQFIMEGTHWQCKLFFTVFHYILATNYIWILVEGLYLNMLITVAVFSEKSGIKWFIIFGWGSYDTGIEILIAIYLLTFLRLAKSTMVLIPLFGVHYIVFIGLPDNVSKEAELVKLYFEMFFNSIQGFVVALLFCFLNGDVQTEIAKTWKRFRLSHGGGSLRSHRDTVTSYVSRGRGSIVSNSNSETERKTSNHELKPLTRIQNDANENHKTNGHVQWQDESTPMIDYQSENCVENHRPND